MHVRGCKVVGLCSGRLVNPSRKATMPGAQNVAAKVSLLIQYASTNFVHITAESLLCSKGTSHMQVTVGNIGDTIALHFLREFS